jgi:hypothetical protein
MQHVFSLFSPSAQFARLLDRVEISILRGISKEAILA